MSWTSLTQEERRTALRVCTPAELAAMQTHEHGRVGYRTAAVILGVSWETVRDRVERGERKVKEAMAREVA